MYNVLVSGRSGTWESEQRMDMGVDRFLEYSGDEARGFIAADPRCLVALERVETILMYETGIRDVPTDDEVRVGRLRDIRLDGQYLTFRFFESGRLPRARVLAERHRFQLADFEFSRTHWAVKDGVLPQDILAEMVETPRRYDVVLSFAGENRAYVEEVATELEAADVSVFYDRNEEATLWGKDLAKHFDQIYRTRARYCVMFASEHYARKVWPAHERNAAFARALEQRTEYILPVRFDDTDIPGLSPTVRYADARTIGASGLAQLILLKLGRHR